MATVQEHLEHATAHLHSALYEIECALSQAQARRFGTNWIDALIRALNDTHTAHLHTGNIPGYLPKSKDPPL